MRNMTGSVLLILTLYFLTASCRGRADKTARERVKYFDSYVIEDGFELQMVATEPLVEAPVVIDFDNRGRVWVVEMPGYMPNLAGTGEDAPNGRISILEDMDGDGIAETSKVFLDSLVLPRALAHVYGGLLYAAPPNLWFVEIVNDRPGKKVLVDSIYSDGGNVESQPNGLMMNVDNWIYNAQSYFRYQLRNGKWLKEPTPFRGQWGISKDNFGRLYYNSNEIQISGDYVLPGTLISNPYLKPRESIDQMLTVNQHVYPLHATTVNRGAEKGILNKDSMLVNVTAACGPLIYRGDQFPATYVHNAFICEPEANLIKRNILHFEALKVTAEQAWTNKEFIASTDEGFRPVNLLNAPDGSMFVVDMHKGIMQHRAYATPYYRNGIALKNLDTVQRQGRIIRVKSKAAPLSKFPDVDTVKSGGLVALLKSANGWVRDRAQQQLVFRKDTSVLGDLRKLLHDSTNVVPAIHALHALEGLNALSFDLLSKVATSPQAMLSAHALLLLEQFSSKENIEGMEALASELMLRNDTVINLYLAISMGPWIHSARDTFLPMLVKLSGKYPGNAVFQEAVVSSLKGNEADFYRMITHEPGADSKPDTVLKAMLNKTIANRKQNKVNSIFTEVSVDVDDRTAGLELFRGTCASCHGADGEGRENIAPSLKESQYVHGPPERLVMILLNGLTGPVQVGGKLQTFNGSMPNFGNNFTDQQIAEVIGYLHNSFVPDPPKWSNAAAKIKSLRNKHTGPLTEKELLNMKDLNK